MASTFAAVPTRATFQLIRIPRILTKPSLSFAAVLCSDIVSIVGSVEIVTLMCFSHGNAGAVSFQNLILPSLLISVFSVFIAFKLYPGVVSSAVTELRSIALALTISFLIVGFLLPLIPGSTNNSLPLVVVSWIPTMIAVPLLRSIMRRLISRTNWWGFPVAVFYTGPGTLELLSKLRAHPEGGLKPVVILAPNTISLNHDLPVLDMRYATAIRDSGVERALIAVPESESLQLLEQMEEFESIFPRLVVIHGSSSLYTLTANATQDLCGSLAVNVRRGLVRTLPRITKRILDMAVVCLIGPALLPMVVLLAMLVKLDSPGPVFFAHRRIGRNNSTFKAWKIRTMHVNSDAIMRDAIVQDPQLRDEWISNSQASE